MIGGIDIKHRVILITKKRLIIYACIIIVAILGIIFFAKFLGKTKEQPSMGYSYLEYRDGTYIGNESTEKGNIKVEVSVKKGKIKNIKILEFPEEYIKDDEHLEAEISKTVKNIIKTQEIMNIEDLEKSSYAINKILKATKQALDESLLQ